MNQPTPPTNDWRTVAENAVNDHERRLLALERRNAQLEQRVGEMENTIAHFARIADILRPMAVDEMRGRRFTRQITEPRPDGESVLRVVGASSNTPSWPKFDETL